MRYIPAKLPERMLNSRNRRYLDFRRQGMTALRAWEASVALPRERPWGSDGQFTYKRLEGKIIVKPDPDPDMSYLGKFCDDGFDCHSEGVYIKTNSGATRKDHRQYSFLELAYPVAARAKDLIEDCKWGARDAWEEAWRQAKEDAKRAVDYQAFGCIVRLYHPGTGELMGEASLWGIDDEEYAFECGLDLLDEAYEDAKRNGWAELRSVLGPVTRKIGV